MEPAAKTLTEHRPVDISVDRLSPTPLHHQVYEALEAQIVSGALGPGEQIRQEKELAAELGISLAPVRQAILSLVRDGYLERSRGKGTFVRTHLVEEQLTILSSFSSLLAATGRPWSVTVLFAGIVTPDQPVSAALAGVARPMRVRRLAVLDEEPVALLDAYFDGARFPGLAEHAEGSIYSRLAAEYGVQMSAARNQIGIASLTADEAGLLQREPDSPVLEMVGVTSDQHGTPTEYSRVLYHPNRFRFQIDSHRHDEGVVRLVQPNES